MKTPNFIGRIVKWVLSIAEVPTQVKRRPLRSPENCMHLEWEPESRENGWRSYCLDCNLTAAGSCQG